MMHFRTIIIILASLAVIGLIAFDISDSHKPAQHQSVSTDPSYNYYESTVSRLVPAAVSSRPSYEWLMGGSNAPAWMSGQSLPGSMMSTMMSSSGSPGEVMGRLWAQAPESRVTAAEANQLAGANPPGATVDATHNTVTFASPQVQLTVVAQPSGSNQFRTAGLNNPTISVPRGANVTIQFVNADPDSAHGLVVTGDVSSAAMPMMMEPPAFAGAATWFLGDATSAGMQSHTINFNAATAGNYQYLSPIPGDAQQGMTGPFTVRG